jgi:hypothetical protein
MHWVLQLESAIGMGAPADAINGHVQIDWAVAYRYAP